MKNTIRLENLELRLGRDLVIAIGQLELSSEYTTQELTDIMKLITDNLQAGISIEDEISKMLDL